MLGYYSEDLVGEALQELYEKHGRSNANVFAQEFGKPPSYWSDLLADAATRGLYKLADPGIPTAFMQLAELVPVSIFSNVDTEAPLRSLGVDTAVL